MSNSVRPQRWQCPRLPRPWNSASKNTGVGCHFLLQCMKVKSESEVAQSCLTLSDPIHGLQPTRLLHPWEFPGKSTGVGCHCLLQSCSKGHLQIAETSNVESVKCQAICIQIFVVNISFPSRKLAAFHQEEFLHLPSWNKFHTHKYLHSLL